jgi:hypothetical protein
MAETAQAVATAPVSLLQKMNPLEAMIERAARDPSIDLTRMERLIELRNAERAEARREAFNVALATAQQKMRRIVADAKNTQTSSRYATYGQLDRAVRDIYTAAGFSVSYDTDVSPKATPAQDYVRVLAFVAHDAGHQRDYKIDIPVITKGPKGNDVMTPTHATISAVSYGKSGLIKMIFNLAIGDDPDDDDGVAAGGGDASKITPEQVKTINDLIEKTGTDLKQFLEYGGIAKIEDIVAVKYEQVVAMLNAKLRKKQKPADDKSH